VDAALVQSGIIHPKLGAEGLRVKAVRPMVGQTHQEEVMAKKSVEEAAPAVATDLGTLVEKYIKVRDRKNQIMTEAKEKAAKFDAVLEKIEGLLLATFAEQGMDSVKTAAGTAYRSTRTSATVADWDSVWSFIQEQGLYDMLEKRVNKTTVEAYKNETGELPPGVNWREELVIGVRRSS
jgi:hypothetical protein